MKGVLAFLKGRLVVVVLVVLMLAMLPTAWFISNMLNKRLVEQQTKAYNEESQKIKKAQRVTYTLPRISELESPDALSVTREPNDRVTKWFETQRAERKAQLETITGRVLELNGEGRTRLVADFPAPAKAVRRTNQQAVVELARAITGTGRGYDRSAYAILFERMGGGTPPLRAEVAESVANFAESERDLAVSRAGPDGRITAEDEKALAERLVERRIGEYRRAAGEFSFYGDASVVTGQVDQGPRGFASPRGRATAVGSYSEIPTEVPDVNAASDAKGYIWQWDYWFIQDLLKAVGKANIDQTGDLTPVPLSVVKRIESIRISQFAMPETATSAVDDFGGAFSSPRGVGGSSDTAQKETITGRPASDPAFDTRHATMTVIVSPARLPVFLDAIRSTSLMTVTDVDLEEIDVWADLAEGYFYGDDEFVMRATIGIESVWLREWTKNFMPVEVRKALGIADDIDRVDDEG